MEPPNSFDCRALAHSALKIFFALNGLQLMLDALGVEHVFEVNTLYLFNYFVKTTHGPTFNEK